MERHDGERDALHRGQGLVQAGPLDVRDVLQVLKVPLLLRPWHKGPPT